KGWLLVDVSNEQGRWVDVPGLARNLIQAMDVHDGGVLELTDSPTVITSARVDELAEVICDPRRNGLVFVAGTGHELSFDPFVRQVGRWTRQVLGQAETVVLDPDATTAFTQAMGTHGVQPWTLRTFRPDVDPARDGDELRHRFITTKRLARADDRDTVRLLGRIARGHAAARTLPAEVTSVAHALTRVENRYVIDAITPQQDTVTLSETPDLGHGVVRQPDPEVLDTGQFGDVAAEAASYLAQIGLAKQILGLDSLDAESLRGLAQRAATAVDAVALDNVTRQLDAQQERIERLEAEKNALTEQLEEAELAHAITDEERTGLEDQVRWLRRRLREREDFEGAFAPMPSEEITQYPTDHSELMDRLPELERLGIVFTGDRKECLRLDEVDPLGRTARVAWEALLVLADYLRARHGGEWDGGVNEYLEQTPAGYRKMSAKKHAPTETGITMRRFGDERVFPVPTTVSPDGLAVMAAHFKLGRLGRNDPRLHYLDDSTGTGKVYVGYIGAHLTNTHTN
ncbi:MAG TPA: hypothetical protein VIS06_09915, partial [Mycobacteriales bacterium]